MFLDSAKVENLEETHANMFMLKPCTQCNTALANILHLWNKAISLYCIKVYYIIIVIITIILWYDCHQIIV